MTFEILILLIAFQIKHLVADYFMQFPYMYENKGKKKGWFKPLFDHAGIHAVGTFVIVHFYLISLTPEILSGEAIPILFGAMIFDFITHFVTDRWKATQKTDPSKSWFWESLGIDQMVHHIVGIVIIWNIV